MEKLGPVSADDKAPEDAKAEKLFQALPVESMLCKAVSCPPAGNLVLIPEARLEGRRV